jgi:hypothetical protein
MRVKMSFTVNGSTHSSIVRLAHQVVADYLECPVEEVTKLADIDIEVEQKAYTQEVPKGYLEDFSGKVFARIK